MSSCNLILYQILPLLLLLLLEVGNAVSENEEYQTYIIHMDHSQKPAYFSTHMSWHQSIVRSLSPQVDDKEELMLYSYNHAMHGFSARLTSSQLSEIQKSPAHVATYKESFGKLYTTHSSEFLGLRNDIGLWPNASYGEGVIIGIIDTGIWPESESFRDKGMPPVPQKWKGLCENGTAFSPSLCNRKLIGARSFSKGLQAAGIKIDEEFDYNSPRDFDGHGTHTSSTAAGNHVLGVSHFGYARGTARGVAPRAHVAMYKVLFARDSDFSAASDVLAGMDQAIADGVDIMSLSLGFDNTPYFKDVIAIAALSAIEKGILVVCAAGNFASHNSTHNGAPWITTVGAGTLDRSFNARMTLENGISFEGISYYPESVYIQDALLYYGNTSRPKAVCANGALNTTEVRGKIVFCDSTHNDIFSQVQELRKKGALAGIFMTEFSILDSTEYSIPSIILPSGSGTLVRDYVTGVNEARVKSMQFVLTRLGTKPAPQVALFSSRGPDPITPAILKPDILAPGVDILAAVAPNKPYMEIGHYKLATDYALYSGTSMAAPHVAGVAALLKAVHPEWSPAAIQSSIMTTAYNLDNNGTTIRAQSLSNGIVYSTPLDFGAGHINPNKAMEPGLIYDMGFQDYVEFLCGLDYTKEQMSAVLRRSHWNCSQQPTDLNYPSFIAIYNNQTASSSKKFTRVVTNVGDDNAVYQAIVDAPTGMRIKIEPNTLKFTQKYQKQGFVVSVEIDKEAPKVVYGYLKWIDNRNHVVSSPIVAVYV
ncbi:subtilisin-like protease SBT1.7 [Tripterygium wilfordii]|uniref:Subtilisin-like protease SBT1.7 n=1 Tax=Tripterygium wilfordii TaxID=458696 RepID=A0A7J7DL62_TRIWF|nr:subtilisin-like protease SBT3 [Tripterygium wilfordii]KAF5747009.1 subtilisin-like protease SBT1.7 [Tripterygium wilfordii]